MNSINRLAFGQNTQCRELTHYHHLDIDMFKINVNTRHKHTHM